MRPGLFARADLGVAMRQGVITVPEEAVLQRAEAMLAAGANRLGTSSGVAIVKNQA